MFPRGVFFTNLLKSVSSDHMHLYKGNQNRLWFIIPISFLVFTLPANHTINNMFNYSGKTSWCTTKPNETTWVASHIFQIGSHRNYPHFLQQNPLGKTTGFSSSPSSPAADARSSGPRCGAGATSWALQKSAGWRNYIWNTPEMVVSFGNSKSSHNLWENHFTIT